MKIKIRSKKGIRTNAEAIEVGIRAFKKIKSKRFEFKEIETSEIRWLLERRVNHTLKPIDFDEKKLMKVSVIKLNKLIKTRDYFDAEDCANFLMEVLFIPRTYRFFDAINRWNVPSWVVLIFEILKFL